MIPAELPHASLVESIEKQTLLHGHDSSGPTRFHPRACMVPDANGPMAFMTLQTILGSDLFGPVHWMTSTDLGRTSPTRRPTSRGSRWASGSPAVGFMATCCSRGSAGRGPTDHDRIAVAGPATARRNRAVLRV